MTTNETTSGMISHPYHTINRPVEFDGTPEEREANYESHSFCYTGGPDDGDVRCGACDSRPSMVHASYPCGASAPRETILFVQPGEAVALQGEGTIDFLHRDGTRSGVLTPPVNGDPVFVTGVEGMTFRLNGEFNVEAA